MRKLVYPEKSNDAQTTTSEAAKLVINKECAQIRGIDYQEPINYRAIYFLLSIATLSIDHYLLTRI